MDVALSILAIVIGGLILAELSAWSPKISAWLTSFAANRVALPRRVRFREEWAAYLAEMPTGFSKLCASLGFIWTTETARLATGVRAVGAIADYMRIRRRLRPYIDEARAFGGTAFAFRLILQPCGNRHITFTALFPIAAEPFIDAYNEALTREHDGDDLDYSPERAEIIERARHAVATAATEQRLARMSLGRMTNFIFWPGQDPRPIRTLLIWLWKARRRKIRRQFNRVEPRENSDTATSAAGDCDDS